MCISNRKKALQVFLSKQYSIVYTVCNSLHICQARTTLMLFNTTFKAYGITGNLINWFKSYLKARRQKVVIKNNSSAYCEISAGVPQGSVLGPLLFIIYINDIADKLISLSRLFADDTSFGYSNRDTMQLKNVIAHDLNEMDIWSKNGLCHLILTKQKS